MVYKKVTFLAILISVIAAVVCNFTFATDEMTMPAANIKIEVGKR